MGCNRLKGLGTGKSALKGACCISPRKSNDIFCDVSCNVF
jgi:hypothetical protein